MRARAGSKRVGGDESYMDDAVLSRIQSSRVPRGLPVAAAGRFIDVYIFLSFFLVGYTRHSDATTAMQCRQTVLAEGSGGQRRCASFGGGRAHSHGLGNKAHLW